jgi:rhodanese-related sulfurtransferase
MTEFDPATLPAGHPSADDPPADDPPARSRLQAAGRLLAYAAVLMLLGLLVACSGSTSPAPAEPQPSATPDGYRDLSPAELSARLSQKDFFFVNVHVPYDGEITGTDAFIPYDQTEQRLGEYPADRNAPVVLYCRSGYMSAIAARELARLGYSEVYNLAGGMAAWKVAGYPLERR